MPIKLQITVRENITESIEDGASILKEPRNMFFPIFQALRRIERVVFDLEGAPPWPSNDSDYKSRKGGKPVGVYRGDLRRSLTTKGAKGSVAQISGGTATFGSKLPWASNFAQERPLFQILEQSDAQNFLSEIVAEMVALRISGREVKLARKSGAAAFINFPKRYLNRIFREIIGPIRLLAINRPPGLKTDKNRKVL